MSLDVYIIYKNPKKRIVKAGIDGVACGSTVAVHDHDAEVVEDSWNGNVTHNMVEMAQHIPVSYTIDGDTYDSTLYMILWRPEEIGVGNVCNNTDVVVHALHSGIDYMLQNREELEKYNPDNGWGNFHSFLRWLIEYWHACDENPGCKIEVSR